jgi:hypothetical protein
MQQMAIVEAELGTDSVFKGMSKETIQQTVEDRFNTLGPLVRNVFVTEAQFTSRKKMLNEQVSDIFIELNRIGVDRMPSKAKNFIGAFVIDEKFVPSLTTDHGIDNWYFIRFLSKYTANLVTEACTKENHAKLITCGSFDYLIAENILIQALMVQNPKDTINPKWKYDRWSFYSNPNAAEAEAQQTEKPKKKTKKPEKETKKPPQNYVTSANRIDRPIFPLCTSQVTFPSMYLDKNVSELEERVLYKSSVHNGALYDCLLVVGNLVYVFQSSSISANSHSLDYSTIKKVMVKLKFHLNPKYKMIYVYCNNNHSKDQTGCKITNNRKNKKTKEPDPLSETEVAAINKRFEIKIARVCYYPHLDEIYI